MKRQDKTGFERNDEGVMMKGNLKALCLSSFSFHHLFFILSILLPIILSIL
jgi:hypothetical protein